MHHPRIGDLLAKLAHLSDHDIEEILREQDMTHHRFGETALSLGMCQPEQVWEAWCTQLADGPQQVDLGRVGIDSQAAACLPRPLAVGLRIIAIRVLSDAIVIATEAPLPTQAAGDLALLLHRHVRFVLAGHDQIERALQMYYTSAA